MFIVKKEFEISASHKLELSYESKCTQMHGHNFKITVFCASEERNNDGMVIDFSHIKMMVCDRFDHTNLNGKLDYVINPTAESLAKYITDNVPFAVACTVQESEGNKAMYISETWDKGEILLVLTAMGAM